MTGRSSSGIWLGDPMTWLQRYRVRHYVRNSVWLGPVLAIGVALVVVRVSHALDDALGWRIDIDVDTTRSVLGTLAGSMFTFVVFVASSLLLVLQLASAQLTPRIIASMFRDRVTKLTLSVFVFTFTFALGTMIRIDDSVPRVTALIAGYGCLVSLGAFLYLVDHVGKMLRPSGVFGSIATQAHGVISQVYPRKIGDAPDIGPEPDDDADERPARTVTSRRPGVVLAFDRAGLVALAARHDCVIEMAPQVGNFVAPGDPLFLVRGGDAFDADTLRQSIELGAERTLEQDPAFAFRVIVDIASKGLSPAINDPTTAVLAIDRIHHLLRHVGKRRLDNARVRDAQGKVRLLYRTPNWEDFVVLAVTEIRHFGASSIQVARRLRAMLEDLLRTLPPERGDALRRELRLLAGSVEEHFPVPEDRALAEISDAQGMGGAGPSFVRRSTTAGADGSSSRPTAGPLI
jgi:uncharacterized membrane protein